MVVGAPEVRRDVSGSAAGAVPDRWSDPPAASSSVTIGSRDPNHKKYSGHPDRAFEPLPPGRRARSRSPTSTRNRAPSCPASGAGGDNRQLAVVYPADSWLRSHLDALGIGPDEEYPLPPWTHTLRERDANDAPTLQCLDCEFRCTSHSTFCNHWRFEKSFFGLEHLTTFCKQLQL